jgi:hypothetical protein
MAKIPDLGKLTEKFDLQGIVKDIKSLLNPGGDLPSDEMLAEASHDPIAQKMAQISITLQNLTKKAAEQEELVLQVSKIVGELYKEVAVLRKKEKTPDASIMEQEIQKSKIKTTEKEDKSIE